MANDVVRRLTPAEAIAVSEQGGELDKQIETAKRYPRSTKESLGLLLDLSTSSDQVAESCLYSLERKEKGGGTKYIVGASIRFAELLVYTWGNIRWGARITDEGKEFVTALGFCHDLERNNAAAVEVRRRITTSEGHRFGVDMIGVTSAAACSIAQRNAAFDSIPEALWRPTWDRSREVAVGTQEQLRTRVDAAIAFFVKAGASEKMIYPALGVKNRGELTLDHVAIMVGLRNAVKDNLIAIDRLFHPDANEERAMLGLTATPTIDQREAVRKAGRGSGRAAGEGLKNADGPLPETSAGAADKSKRKGKADKEDSPPPAEPAADPAAPADNAAADAGDADPGPSDADVEKEDADLVASIEAKLEPGKAMSNRKAVNEHRGALARIAETGPDALKERAATILKEYPAQ